MQTAPEDSKRRDALRKIRKKVCGSAYGAPRCAVCHKVYSDDEILAEDFIWSVGRSGSVQICKGCLGKYLSGQGGMNVA